MPPFGSGFSGGSGGAVGSGLPLLTTILGLRHALTEMDSFEYHVENR
jgi:hypothetical protein